MVHGKLRVRFQTVQVLYVPKIRVDDFLNIPVRSFCADVCVAAGQCRVCVDAGVCCSDATVTLLPALRQLAAQC